MVLQAVAIDQQKQPAFVDEVGCDAFGRVARVVFRKRNKQAVFKQCRLFNVASGKGQRQQHTIHLSMMQCVNCSGAGFFAQI